MELAQITLVSAASVVVLFILTKLMGNHQMSQLSMFDYITGITIGSIAAEMATSLEGDFLKPLVAMAVYTAFSLLISYSNTKSIRLRRIITGESLILLENGKLYKKNLEKARLDVNEFLVQCRNCGYFNIADLQTAILEPNGKISFLPLSSKRPVNPTDLSLDPPAETRLTNVIIDGKILPDNLKFTGNNEEWLKKQLHAQGISQIADIFLASCDASNTLTVYVKITAPMTRDPFE